jgi:hypothetical protein
MVRGLFRLFPPLVTALLALTAGAITLGQTRPSHIALEGFHSGCDGAATPCWYGVVPGVTTAARSDHLTRQAAPQISDTVPVNYMGALIPDNLPGVCGVRIRIVDNITLLLDIDFCPESAPRLGDIALLWGLPLPPSVRVLTGNSPFASSGVARPYGWVSPFAPVNSARLTAIDIPEIGRRWHGFMPMWRYCQLEPAYSPCPG